MSILVINDLPESIDLDRQAMAAISGGAKIRAHQSMLAPRPLAYLHTGDAASPFARETPDRPDRPDTSDTPDAAAAPHAVPTLLR
ncbi:hypothetical protein [Burkholderia guangdongensis]|uniref:hypothetical protein n=1 Tax=Burkholderia guangdongensis TaxID=1792500 RepID=UPI0015CB5931|nr:hypothetical protein [Burkholderia guangdongensis]